MQSEVIRANSAADSLCCAREQLVPAFLRPPHSSGASHCTAEGRLHRQGPGEDGTICAIRGD